MHRSTMHALKRALSPWRLLKGFILLVLILGILLGLDFAYPLRLDRFKDCAHQVLDRNGALFSVLIAKDKRWRFDLPLEEVDPFFIKLLIAFEDKRFYYHPGVDPLALLRALIQFCEEGRIISGGSTITMQTARLLEPRARTLKNKVIELLRALQLEYHFSKKEILEMYLRLAPYGGNIEGLSAATLNYFGKSPQYLQPKEAAFLVALPQSPALGAYKFRKKAEENTDKVLKRIAVKLLPGKILEENLQAPVRAKKHPFPHHSRHFSNYLIKQFPGNNTYHTTLDLEIQKQLETALRHYLNTLDNHKTVSAMIVENHSRDVVAYVGSAAFFDKERQGEVDMNLAIRSPGSLLKPFIYALAFEQGLIRAESILQDMPQDFSGYAPSNFKDVFHGEVEAKDALQKSLNVPAVFLLQKLGAERFASHLKSFNIALKFARDTVSPTLPIALGGVGMNLRDLMSLYVTLANGGEFKPLNYIKEKREYSKGQKMPIKENTPKEKPPSSFLTTPAAAQFVTHILAGMSAPSGYLDREMIRGAQLAYKTGTSYGYRDAWAIGYTPDYTIGIWVGRPDGSACPNQTGRDVAAPLLFQIVDLLPYSGKLFKSLLVKGESAEKSEIGSRLANIQSVQKKTPKISHKGLQIKFPKEGSILNLEFEKDKPQPIPIQFERGSAPFYLFVNDELIQTLNAHKAFLELNEPGFHKLTVLDSKGQSQSVTIELRD